MKITSIGASNYQRLTAVNIAVRAPLLLLAGENEAGKTSLADAIYHAINGTARRVALKKDHKDLVHDGQKNGYVTLGIADPDSIDGEDIGISVTVPSDKRTCPIEVPPLMTYLLDATLFPKLKPEERRSLLFGVTGTKISGKLILEKLLAKGADPVKAKKVSAVLLSGFAAGAAEAKREAAEARGSWKAVAGEAYGSKKAEGWTAPKPEYDAHKLVSLEASIADAAAKLADANTKLGGIAEKRRLISSQQERRRALVTTADELERRQAKLAADQKLVDEWTEKVAHTAHMAGDGPKVDPVSCPHCGGMLEIHAGELTEHAPGKAGDAQAIAMLPKYRQTLEQVTRARDNAQRDVTASQNARAALDELDMHAAAEPDAEEESGLRAAKTAYEQSQRALQATLDEIKAAKAKADRADADTKKAGDFHADVLAWEAIEEWLSPSGIQAELLHQALDPFNARMANTAAITGWEPTTIDSDMTIRVGGRAHSLCSASARWRAEATITEALAHLSGIKTFLLDELEILIGRNRIAFLTWMHKLAAAGEVDTAILIGSFKEAPQCPSTYQVEWVQAGRAGRADEQEQEAA